MVFIEQKLKCVSSCEREDPLIYLFHGNCVEECPIGYIPDDNNHICILENKDNCTLGTKIGILSHVYSLDMTNSLAKGYIDEYYYTDKYIEKIYNSNYNIYIFKDFECLEELDINIPDIRNSTHGLLEGNNDNKIENDSCYKKILNELNIEENKLLVIYFEDKTNIGEKGYLLYNPFTGRKILFENICGENELYEQNDIINYEENNFK